MNHFQISIPKPCPKNWKDMTPADGGRHCCACDKVVVDFTAMNEEEIKSYFKSLNSQRICGHFKMEQVTATTTSVQAILNRVYEYIEKKLTLALVRNATLFLLGICMTLAGCYRHRPKTMLNGGVKATPVDNFRMVNGEPMYVEPKDSSSNSK